MKEKWSVKLILLAVGAVVALILGFALGHLGMLGYAVPPIILGGLILSYFIFKNPQFGFLLIIFFLPFERVPTLPLGGLDVKINTVLGFLTLLAWLLASMFNGKKWKIEPNALSWPLGLFVIALLLSLTQALNLTRGAEVLIFTLFTIILSILTVNMLPDKTAVQKMIWALFISASFIGLFGLFQFAGNVVGLPNSITQLKVGYDSAVFGFPRIQALSMEPLYYANYLLIPLSLAFAYYLGRIQVIPRWWLILIMVVLLVNFVLTVSRGGYLGLAVTFLIFVIFYFKHIFTRRVLVIMAIFAVVGGGVYYALRQSENRALDNFVRQATLQDAKTGSESVQGRLSTFEFAYNAFKRYPILGLGIGNYGPYAKSYPSTTPKKGWDIVNNQFIELLAETGLVGVISYGLIIFFLILRSFIALKRATDPMLKATLFGLLAAFVGVMVQYNFFSTLYIIHIWVLIGLLIAVQNVILKNQIKEAK